MRQKDDNAENDGGEYEKYPEINIFPKNKRQKERQAGVSGKKEVAPKDEFVDYF